MAELNRITLDPDICNGQPTIRGMRITAETVLDFLAAGESSEEILRQYPILEREEIQACLAFASYSSSNSISCISRNSLA